MQPARTLVGLTLAFPLAMGTPAQAPSPQLRLYGEVSGTRTFLVDNNGRTVHTWNSTRRPGLSCYLMPDGNLVRSINVGSPPGPAFGGAGGGVQLMVLDGTVVWDFRYNTNGVWSHHDMAVLPNGNILMTAAEDKTRAEAIAAGRNPAWISTYFRMDHLIEVMPTGPTSGTIVWEWHLWDHLIQDFDPAQSNYGVVRDNPQLYDINHVSGSSVSYDMNHTNAIDYDPVHDWIIMSSWRANEVWIIDHSTTKAEAAGHTGGSYGMGGDLIYRWGNPAAYDRGTSANQTLFGQHGANFIPQGYPGQGNILLFNNNRPGGSSVDEFVLPLDVNGRFILEPGQPYGPAAAVWSHRGGFSSGFLSSARRAPNGNTLICSGNQGRVLEVTPGGQQVWTGSINTGSIFHAHYIDDSLWADRKSLSMATGGRVTFDMIAGSAHANQTYLLLGSASGTSPGLTLNGQLLPLNADGWFTTTLTQANRFPFENTLGQLDGLGKARASLTIPSGLTPLVGLQLNHAFVTFGLKTPVVTRASNAKPLDFVQ